MKQVTGNQQLVTQFDVNDHDIQSFQRPWHRLPDETHTAFSYFKHYLQLPAPRNVGRLAKHLRKSRSGLARYSAEFKWVDRATAYDDWMTGKQLEKQKLEAEKRDMAWLERREVQREQEWELAQEMLDKVRQMLRVPLFKETVHEYLKDLDPDGKIIIEQIVHYEPLDWSAVDISRYLDIATKVARLATGMDTDQKKLRIDVSALSDAELEKLTNQ